jgi:glycosyltransferase involved in cell wall biosynthesis
MDAIRVLFPFVGGATIGGSHISALKLAAALDRSRFDAVIVLHREAGALGDYVAGIGLDYEVLTDPPIMAPRAVRTAADATFPGYFLRSLPRLVAFLRDARIDIVHTNDGRMHATWGLPARLAGRRFVWHHRGSPSAAGVNLIAGALAHRILAVSHFARPSRPIRSIEEKFSVVRSPFDFSGDPPDRAESHAALCRELGLPPDSILLGYFGVLNDRKRPVHFVEAVAAAAHAMPAREIHGLIFGRPEAAGAMLDEMCRARAEGLRIADRLHLMGFRSPIEPAMSGVDALLVTALAEPFGRTLIEAMHLGTPVIATDHGGNPEAIADGRTGFLVDPINPVSFADPVRRLVEDADLRRRVTASAREKVHQSYGLERHVAEVSRVYLELAERVGHAREVNA